MADSPFLASNLFTGDGTTTIWEFSFAGLMPDAAPGTTPYIDAADVKAEEIIPGGVDEEDVSIARELTLVGPNQAQVTPAVAVGNFLRVYRETENRFPLVNYQGLQAVSEFDLDLANRQAVYIVQEARDAARGAGNLSAEALALAQGAAQAAEEAAEAAAAEAAEAAVQATASAASAAAAVAAIAAGVLPLTSHLALPIVAGVVTVNTAVASSFGIELTEDVTSIVLTGATAGKRNIAVLLFKQPDAAGGQVVTLPASFRLANGEVPKVSVQRGVTTLLVVSSTDTGTTWVVENFKVFEDFETLPALVTENALLNDEGDSTVDWATSGGTVASAASVLRLTKSGAPAANMTKTINVASAADLIMYGRVRLNAAAASAVLFRDGAGAVVAQLWLNSADGGATYSAGAVSIATSTGNTVATGATASSTIWLDYALQFDNKFLSATLWLREADGRWKKYARRSATFAAVTNVRLSIGSAAATNAWIEFDFLSVCKPNIVVIGDSIAEGKTLYSPNLSLALGDDESTWMRHANLYPALRNNLIVNKAVGSETSAQLLARIADATVTTADLIIVHASTNDTEALPLATRTSQTQSIVDAVTASGAACVLLNSMYGTDFNDNPGRRDFRREWWEDYMPTLTGVACSIDIMVPMINADGYMATNLTQSDGIHPKTIGYTRIGDYIETFQ